MLEAKLANARSDATMMLQGVQGAALVERMRELVESNADPAVSYLLTATPWGTNYLRSRLPNDRGEPSEVVLWDRYRTNLARGLLDDTGRAAFDRA